MTRARAMPLESFDPQLLKWLVRAGSGKITLKAETEAERKRLPERVHRLRALRVRMVEEKHPMAKSVSGLWIKLNREAGTITIQSRDSGLEALKVDFEESLAITPPDVDPRIDDGGEKLMDFLRKDIERQQKPSSGATQFAPPMPLDELVERSKK